MREMSRQDRLTYPPAPTATAIPIRAELPQMIEQCALLTGFHLIVFLLRIDIDRTRTLTRPRRLANLEKPISKTGSADFSAKYRSHELRIHRVFWMLRL